eukprot:scaffold83053_cov17-Tisochrysis_lutea.AAC.2
MAIRERAAIPTCDSFGTETARGRTTLPAPSLQFSPAVRVSKGEEFRVRPPLLGEQALSAVQELAGEAGKDAGSDMWLEGGGARVSAGSGPCLAVPGGVAGHDTEA